MLKSKLSLVVALTAVIVNGAPARAELSDALVADGVVAGAGFAAAAFFDRQAENADLERIALRQKAERIGQAADLEPSPFKTQDPFSKEIFRMRSGNPPTNAQIDQVLKNFEKTTAPHQRVTIEVRAAEPRSRFQPHAPGYQSSSQPTRFEGTMKEVGEKIRAYGAHRPISHIQWLASAEEAEQIKKAIVAAPRYQKLLERRAAALAEMDLQKGIAERLYRRAALPGYVALGAILKALVIDNPYLQDFYAQAGARVSGAISERQTKTISPEELNSSLLAEASLGMSAH